ncbi:Nup93/Nic96-domain-containing protein [Filobasidium floriforme]|uniref:Nup93/Nic96-domain-containing protein n=1 Tax=Filobasidium floriforme TaxID=5210 RepID=UPI001E8E8FE7|nr:Nup93/Nic96-domain-containing protein [Filobasidium floriforme]KAH8084740.1 Nup93/Nic96-domain-containing protein [Filobasidium floriforme]
MSSLQALANESYGLLPPGSRLEGIPQLNSGIEDVLSGSAKLAKARAGLGLVGRGGASGLRSSTNNVASGSNADGGAAYLLATHGINAPSLSSQINQFSQTLPTTAQTTSAAPQSSHNDAPLVPLPTFLQQHKEKIILSAISDTLRRAVRDSEERWIDRCDREWKSQRAKILEEMGVGNSSGAQAALGESTMGRSRFGQSTMKPNFSASTMGGLNQSTRSSNASNALEAVKAQQKMMQYDSVVKALNSRRKEKKPFPIINYMKGQVSSEKESDLGATYTLLSQLLSESADGSAPGERAYAKGYMAEDQSRERCEVLTKLISNGTTWLERAFAAHVDKVLSEKVKEIQVGGVPGFRSKVSAYVTYNYEKRSNPLSVRLEKVANSFFWVEVFYLMRGGRTDDALELAQEKQHAMPRKDRNFAGLFRAWVNSADRTLPAELRTAFETDFNARIKHNLEKGDPFKYAVYKLLGRQEIHKKNIPDVIQHTEDWMWFQLSLVREVPSVGSGLAGKNAGYSLKDLGALVVKYGEADLKEGKVRSMVYFQRLLMTAQFEKAIAFLYEDDKEIDAVHFAIALTYYGLLRVPDARTQSETEIFTGKAASTPLTANSFMSASGVPLSTVDVVYCNFARLIQRYVRNFVRVDTPAALQYVYLLSLNADAPGTTGEEQVQACWDMIQAVILETRSYNLVLNEKAADGQSIPSVLMRDVKLVKVRNPDGSVRDLIARLAASAPADLPLNDRIELYKLAGQYDRIMAAINKQLSDSLDQPGTGAEAEGQDDLLAFVRFKLDDLRREGVQVGSAGQTAANQLQKLREAKGWTEKADYEKALAAVQATELIPLDRDVPGITRAAEDFKHVDDNITRKIDKVLVMTMNAIFELNQRAKSDQTAGDRQDRMQRLRKQERALMMFAGMLRYRLSSETYAQLAHYDAFF